MLTLQQRPCSFKLSRSLNLAGVQGGGGHDAAAQGQHPTPFQNLHDFPPLSFKLPSPLLEPTLCFHCCLLNGTRLSSRLESSPCMLHHPGPPATGVLLASVHAASLADGFTCALLFAAPETSSSFMGACTVPPNLSIVTQFAPRGSLFALLHKCAPPSSSGCAWNYCVPICTLLPRFYDDTI